MSTSQLVAAAARVGRLSHEAHDREAVAQALQIVRDVVGGDAACLVSNNWDAIPHPLVTLDYPNAVTDCITGDFMRSPWHQQVLESALPVSISREQEQRYIKGWIYEEVLAPAGFRDGVTGALWHQGRYVGTVHLSSTRERHFDDDQRALLGAFADSLAAIADVNTRLLAAPTSADDDAACLVVNGESVALEGRSMPAVAHDREVLELAAAVSQIGGTTSCLWPVSASHWYRVRLSRQLDSGGQPVVVLTQQEASAPYRISRRELDVLTRMTIGMSNEAIAESLSLSPRTVHTHVENILSKTGARSRTEAAALASWRAIIRPSAELLRHDHLGVLHQRASTFPAKASPFPAKVGQVLA